MNNSTLTKTKIRIVLFAIALLPLEYLVLVPEFSIIICLSFLSIVILPGLIAVYYSSSYIKRFHKVLITAKTFGSIVSYLLILNINISHEEKMNLLAACFKLQIFCAAIFIFTLILAAAANQSR